MVHTAILLINLGTPRAPTLKHVFHYLNEFLTDGRVIDLPWWKRQLLVRGLIVPTRLRQSTHSYQRIWTEEGSPLMVYGVKVKKALQNALGEGYSVELAMRYQQPSIENGLTALLRHQPHRLIILPLFPQYASATTGSVHQKVMELLRHQTVIPEVTFISHFAYEPAFHNALVQVATPLPMDSYDHILFSYHGLPQRHLQKADTQGHCLKCADCCQKVSQKHCYAAQCHATTRGVVDLLKIPTEKYSLCFQSRLGRDPWLQPYASDKIVQLAQEGKRRVLVFCPSFVCDCLETLFEIGEEYGALFQKAGGKTLDLVPGLNDHPAWIAALQKIILRT
ncbi:MAG: ferrochelatase [Parachlamydia sp.]|nr:ferrochelatase [Parachlamydia sp.]